MLLRILLQLLLHVYLCRGGDPPPDKFQISPDLSRDPGFRCQIIPELVWPYSRTRLLKFRSRLAHSWIHLAFLIEKVANMVPTWLPKWSQDGQKIDPKIDHFLMLLKSIFGWIMLDYGPKLSHVGNKMVSKIDANFERPFFKKHCFSYGKPCFLRSNASKLETYTDQKTFHKWSPRWNASWHWSLNDFVRCLVPSW